ncbi:MAG: hypothetical protein HYZ14_07515 [Bacteroidetes bacterium]|nr:hypothetical protein [Bacteroidota bacterium]
MSFDKAVVSSIDKADCWLDILVVDSKGTEYKFDHCFCGLGEDLDILVGDTLKKSDPVKFYNCRLEKEFELNCCDH